MLKEIIKISVLVAAGMMVYDINKAGSFIDSDIYKFLKENGVVDFAEVCFTYLVIVFNHFFNFSEPDKNTFIDDEMCSNIHAYGQLFYNMILVWKNSILSLFENSSHSFNKTFPTAVDDVSTLVSGALTSTKEGLVVISSHVQNMTLLAVNYANEVFRT